MSTADKHAPEGAEEVGINSWNVVESYFIGQVGKIEPLEGKKVRVMSVRYPDGSVGRVICPTALEAAIKEGGLEGAWVKALYTGTVKTQGGQVAKLFRVWRYKEQPTTGGFIAPSAAGVTEDDDIPF
jgi:hypothetical protein